MFPLPAPACSLPPEYSEKYICHWPVSGDERFSEYKMRQYVQVHKGLVEGAVKPFRKTHLGSKKYKGTVSDEVNLVEGLRQKVSAVTGVQTVEVHSGADVA